MIVVSDTSVLHYLVLIEQVDILPFLFEKVIIPRAVLAELEHPGAPEAVRNWLTSAPNWLVVQDAPPYQPETGVDRGEAEAIALALSLAVPLLIDDRRGREYAKRVGVSVVGTIGLLDRAARMGRLDYGQSLRRLAETTFHISQRQINSLLKAFEVGPQK